MLKSNMFKETLNKNAKISQTNTRKLTLSNFQFDQETVDEDPLLNPVNQSNLAESLCLGKTNQILIHIQRQ